MKAKGSPPRLGVSPGPTVYRRAWFDKALGLEVSPLYAVWRRGQFAGYVGRWHSTWLVGILPDGEWLGWPNVERYYTRYGASLRLAMHVDGIEP